MSRVQKIAACFALVVTVAAAALLLTPSPACAGNCGLKPLKPLTPLNCRDLVAVCVCDAQGQNCRWEWHCTN